MAETVMHLWPDSMAMKPGHPAGWSYDQGIVLNGLEQVWLRTGKGKYFNYIQKSMDLFVQKDGNIRTYKQADYNIDNIKSGCSLLLLYEVLEEEKYKKGAQLLREQLAGQPRTKEGGFWHKKRYPNQMWLDGLYMGEPFYAQYAQRFNEPSAFDDIANQFVWMEKHARDARTGLLYHGWDENKTEKWSNPANGQSSQFWGRAMGWYGMALVDILDYFPADHPRRNELLSILQRYITAVKQVQDKTSGIWWQVLNKPNEKGNYPEASASCMFVYTLAKALRMAYTTDATTMTAAKKGFDGIIKNFITVDNGQVNLNKVCQVAGLGGTPYRDGSYAYYIGEPVVTNDPKGIGAFILAAAEMENLADQQSGVGKGKTVLLDYYFNNERKKNKEGNTVRFHYIWEDWANSGFSLWGHVFRNTGAATASLETAPTADNLKKASVYIIVDPDIPTENPHPNYIEQAHITAITNWVKAGGTLILMGNDSINAEFKHLNQLAAHFGIQFNEDCENKVIGRQFEMGMIRVNAGNPVFKRARQVYIKELATLNVKAPAQAVLTHKGKNIVAVSKLGKGKVFAVGDPWVYNEYTDGRRLPADYQNFEVAQDIAEWALKGEKIKIQTRTSSRASEASRRTSSRAQPRELPEPSSSSLDSLCSLRMTS